MQGWSLVLQIPRRGTVQSGSNSMQSIARVSLRVDGASWEQVETLEYAQPNDQAYVVSIANDGTATIRFGDGKCGRRLPIGVEHISAYYRAGGGSSGNVPKKKNQCNAEHLDLVYLDVWTREVATIEDVQICESALDGSDISIRGPRPLHHLTRRSICMFRLRCRVTYHKQHFYEGVRHDKCA